MKLFSQIAYSFFARAPRSWEKKFSMMMDLKATDWRRMRKLSPMSLEFSSRPDLDKHFKGLDPESLTTLQRFIAKMHFLPDAPHLYAVPPSYAFLWSGLCTQKEFDEAIVNEKELPELKKKFHVQNSDASSLIHHHGLRYLPAEALAYLQNKIFVDAGAFEFRF